MRLYLYLIATLLFISCNDSEPVVNTEEDSVYIDSTRSIIEPTSPISVKKGPFQNERFRNVTINREGDSVRVQGEAQIFEASFSYTIEDGHNILAEGHSTTDAGAPAWGRFDFTTFIPEHPSHLTPHIILYEASAKDGSAQYQLSIPLK